MRFDLLCLIALAMICLLGCAATVETPEAVDIPIETHCQHPVINEPDWQVNGLHPPVGVFTGVQGCYGDLPLHYSYEAALRATLTACQ